MSEHFKKHWPVIPTFLSACALATGIAFGATKQFMIPIGTSNLPMVLSLCGSSMLIAMAFLYHATSMVIYEEKGKGASIELQLLAALFVIGCGYAAVHFGLSRVLPSSLTIAESIGAQAGIGFAIGCVFTFMAISIIDRKDFKKEWHAVLTASIAAGICVATSSALGPALVATIGEASAVSATDAIVLEATISVSVALFSCMFVLSAVRGARELAVAKSHID